MKTTSKLFKFLFIIILAASCNNKIPDNFDYGSVENGIYENEYFDFKINLPEDWVVQSKEQIDNLKNSGKDIVAGDDEKMKAILKASEVNSANLLVAFQHELGAAVEYNPNIMIIAENVKNSPGIKNGSDYLIQAKKLLQQTQIKYDFISEDFEKEKISSVEFYKMETHMSYMGLEIKQTYYSTVLKGFSFNIIISYVSDDQKEVLLNTLNSLKFKK